MNLKSIFQTIPAPGWVVVVVSCVLAALVGFLPASTAARVTSESGPFEVASAILWAICWLLALELAIRRPSLVHWAGVVVVLWALLRELDFQKQFTYRSVMSLGYYTRPRAPWSEKLIVLAVLTPFLVAGIILLLHVCRRWRAALARREAWVGNLFGAALLIGVGLFLEKILRIGTSEEVLEIGPPMMFLLILWSLRATSVSPACPAPVQNAEVPERPD